MLSAPRFLFVIKLFEAQEREYTIMDNAITLYYDKKSDRIISYPGGMCEALFVSHNKSGYKHNEPAFKVPDTNFEIKIESNFGYGSRSYLRCKIRYNDIKLLNLNNWACCISENIDSFEVEPKTDNWPQLFDIITSVYKQKESWNYDNLIDVLYLYDSYLSDIQSIQFRNHSWSINNLQYDDSYKKIIKLIKKINELFPILNDIKLMGYNQIRSLLKSISHKLIHIIPSIFENLNNDPTLQEKDHIIHNLIIGYDVAYSYLKQEQEFELILSHLK